MYGTNLNAEPNFHLQAFNQYGIKYVTGPYTSYNLDVFRAFTATTDCVITATAVVGDSLTNEIIYAGTTVYGLFISIVVTSGNAVLHLAEPSVISELVNSYYNTAAQYGYYSEAQKCTSERLNPYLAGGLYDKASWLLIPSQVEEDFVRAFKPTDNSGSLSFTRASDATRTNAAGEIERTPWNLLQFSQMFADAYWTKSGTTISANFTIAPNGTLTADKLIPTVSTSTKGLIRSDVFTVDGATRSWSIFVKGDGYRYVVFGEGTIVANSLIFDTAIGTYTQSAINQYFTSILTPVNAGNGWWRIGYSTNLNSAFYDNFTLSVTNSPTGVAASFAGNGTDGILIWGAQVVEGTDAKPYFPTTNRLDVPRLDYRNADGTVNSCPRLLLEPQRTNSIRNSSMVGAVAGSPGTLPTNWTSIVGGGLTRTIVGIGTEGGLQYIDFRFNGTANDTQLVIGFDSAIQIAAAVNQVWSNSFYVKNIDTTTAANDVTVYTIERSSVGGFLSAGDVSIKSQITTSLKRFTNTRTLASATTAYVQPAIRFTLTSGATYDFTIRIAAPQMELGAYATTFIPTTTAAVTRLADVASKTGVSSLIGQTSGTLFVEWDNSDKGLINLMETYNNASTITGTSSIIIQKTGTANQINIRVFDSLGSYSDQFTATMPNGTNKLALAYQPGSAVYYLNGSFVGGNTRTYVFGSTRDTVGFDNRAPYPRAQAALFPTRLSNEELALITTI